MSLPPISASPPPSRKTEPKTITAGDNRQYPSKEANSTHMAEVQMPEPGAPDSQLSGPPLSANAAIDSAHGVSEVSETWQLMMQGVLGFVLLLGAIAMFHYYAPLTSQSPAPGDLQREVHDLNSQVAELQQERAMPATVLNRYRNSIGYIYGVYQVGFADQKPTVRARVSGTGFLVADGLLATNRHVAQPWFGDPEAEALIRRGANATLESVVVFFPGSPTPVSLALAEVSSTSDLALLRMVGAATAPRLTVLPLAKSPGTPGDLVTVVGYPMGIAGMVAKSPNGIYEKLAYRHNDITAASELAALSLIRPSATYGHLGDVVGDKLIYDAPTAHGGSGGPVFNSKGEVIGINSAYMDGFSGGTLGISVDSLRPLIKAARKQAQ